MVIFWHWDVDIGENRYFHIPVFPEVSVPITKYPELSDKVCIFVSVEGQLKYELYKNIKRHL